tara:strand:+ start:238 stop:738 length:501 start_codon:yes stop_codon:yes gene_type:complete
MNDIFVTSDTHFNHVNMLNFKGADGKPVRYFDNVNEMNETIIDNWNRVVRPQDKIYHLGDVFFGSKEEFKVLWSRLNGKKRLIVGNHDDIKFLSGGNFFQKVYMWRLFKEFGLILTHVPINQDNFRSGTKNVHGHVHTKPSPVGPYQCVCTEVTNYTPVNIESLSI